MPLFDFLLPWPISTQRMLAAASGSMPPAPRFEWPRRELRFTVWRRAKLWLWQRHRREFVLVTFRATAPPQGFLLAEQQELGDEALRFREAFFEENGNTQGWLSAFMRERLHFDSTKSSAARAAYTQIKCAVRTAQGGIEKVKQQHGKKSMTCQAGAVSRSRKRRKGGGARQNCWWIRPL